ncbi:MAG TPA: helix-turn-helix domain-containing protein [Acidimicrobiales bacterium]|nr:helix-turn-helix domain-containing protein [Acidimicrobiales bacterium]
MTDGTSARSPAAGGPTDEVGERLLDAAAHLVAREGVDGARLQAIVREAGLTTGAVYGRYRGKHELLHDAVVTRTIPQERLSAEGLDKVADLVATGASRVEGELADAEALLLETYVAARRDPDLAAAVAEADRRWKDAVAPLVDAALLDGTVDDDVDPAAVLFLVRVLRLGLLVHRGSGLPGPDPDGWEHLVARVVASFGRPADAAPPTATAAVTTSTGTAATATATAATATDATDRTDDQSTLGEP